VEPAWDANLSPHPSGLRPGRSGHDAIGALGTAIRLRPQSALNLAIAKGCERIDQQALWAKGQAPPRIRRPLKAWLKAGLLDAGHLWKRNRFMRYDPRGGKVLISVGL